MSGFYQTVLQYATPKEMFMMQNLAEESMKRGSVAIPWFERNWKSRTFDGEKYWWAGRYRSQHQKELREMISFIREKRSLNIKYRTVKDGAYTLLYVTNIGFVSYNFGSHPI